jgi:uncharacterized membrane protein (DUF373 family)
MEKHLLNGMKHASRYIIILLMLVLLISMILGAIDLVFDLYHRIVSPSPYRFLIKTEDLYSIFSVLLIIIVGYELFKSLYLILKSDQIPVKSICKVAAIAMANKVITLNLKETPPVELFGVGALIIAIGVAYFFFNKDNQITD